MSTSAPRGKRLSLMAPAPIAAAEPHVHGPGCAHDHGHDHGPKEEHPVGARPAETGGAACQLDLAVIIPGETDDKGRFQKLETLLEAHAGVVDAHLRRDAGHEEVCVHYDSDKITM